MGETIFPVVIFSGILFSLTTPSFWRENSFPSSFHTVKTCFVLSLYRMVQIKGKELIRQLAWLVYQDQENYRHQLEEAVSISLCTL